MSTYLVTQATGQQGQQVVRHLLHAGLKVHALVRDLQKVPDLLKDSSGVTLFQGQSLNLEDVVRAAHGCAGAYLNTFNHGGIEPSQARTIVAGCKKAGVRRIVAATTIGTGDRSMWDNDVGKEIGIHEYYLSKTEVEDAVRGAGLDAWTILRAGVLLQDFLLPGVSGNFPGLPDKGELDHPFDDGVKSPFTDAYDVGRFAAAALQDPDRFNGHEIELSNEAMTVEEVHELLVRVSGKPVGLRKRTTAEIEECKTTVYGQRFSLAANRTHFGAFSQGGGEVEAKYGIRFTSAEEALQREKARLLETLPL